MSINLWIEAPPGELTLRRDFAKGESVRAVGKVEGAFGLPEPFVTVRVTLALQTGEIIQVWDTNTNAWGNYWVDFYMPWDANYYMLSAKWWGWWGGWTNQPRILFTVARAEITTPPPPVPPPGEPEPPLPPESTLAKAYLAQIAKADSIKDLELLKAAFDSAYGYGQLTDAEYATISKAYEARYKALSPGLPSWAIPAGVGVALLGLVVIGASRRKK